MLMTAQKSGIENDYSLIGKSLDQFQKAQKHISTAKPNNHSSIINNQSKVIPSYSETAVWCELTEGIDPAEWAKICRKIGQLQPHKFAEVQDFLNSNLQSSIINNKSSVIHSPDSLFSRLKRTFCFNLADFDHLPLVSVGPEGIKS